MKNQTRLSLLCTFLAALFLLYSCADSASSKNDDDALFSGDGKTQDNYNSDERYSSNRDESIEHDEDSSTFNDRDAVDEFSDIFNDREHFEQEPLGADDVDNEKPDFSNEECNETSCGDYGSCDLTGKCVCNEGYGGDLCDRCDEGYGGFPDCIVDQCNGHGDKGSSPFGPPCDCYTGFGGTYCNQCATGFEDYPNCVPEGSKCNPDPCNGNGECLHSDGSCECKLGFDGAGCDKCSGGYSGYPDCKLTGDPCADDPCGGKGNCDQSDGSCECFDGYDGNKCDKCKMGYTGFPDCVVDMSKCGGCSGHGTCITWNDTGSEVSVCACDPGFTASDNQAKDCVPTSDVCVGGDISGVTCKAESCFGKDKTCYDMDSGCDVDGDGVHDTTFEPNAYECEMFEKINYTRATRDDSDVPNVSGQAHTSLRWNVREAAVARHHSRFMGGYGSLYHDEHSGGQNCAWNYQSVDGAMNGYMDGPNEPPCPALSHHCNIMRATFTTVGVGYWTGTVWNTQNFTSY